MLKSLGLSKEIGMSSSQLSEYESGKKTPNAYTLACIAEGLGVSLDDLYYGPSSTRVITAAHSKAEEIVNCFATLAEQGIFEVERFSYRVDSGYEESTHLVTRKYEDELMELCYALENFQAKSKDYPDPEIIRKNILAAATKQLERLRVEEEIQSEDLPF